MDPMIRTTDQPTPAPTPTAPLPDAAQPLQPPITSTAMQSQEAPVTPAPSQPDEDIASEATVPTQVAATPIPSTPKTHHRPVAAVVAAVIIAFVLAGLGTFAYLKSNQTSKKPQTHNSSVATTTTKPTATTQDVDAATTAIDSALQTAGDGQSFSSSNDLSDTTLGL